jgi:glycosyltransferase involved in cell wall biosynthesis
MKIVHIVPTISIGGLQKFALDLSNTLNKMNHEVHIIILDKERDDDMSQFFSKGVSQHYIYNNEKRIDVSLFKKIYKLVHKIKPNIIHTHGISLLYSALLIIFSNFNFIHTVHNLAQNESGKVRRHINKIFFKYFEVLPVAISDEVRQSILSYYSLNSVVKIDNGLTKPEKTNKYLDVVKFISKIKTTPDTKVLINVGRVDGQKNQKLLIDSYIKLKQKGYKLVLIIVGQTGGSGNTFFNELKGYVSSDDVYFIGTVDNVVDYLLCSDIFCLSSKFEGLPISLLEAMSVGLIPSCTPAGGIISVLNNKYGYVSNNFSTDSYVKSLENSILNTKHISSQKLVDLFDNNYDMKICATSYVKEYKNRVDKRL